MVKYAVVEGESEGAACADHDQLMGAKCRINRDDGAHMSHGFVLIASRVYCGASQRRERICERLTGQAVPRKIDTDSAHVRDYVVTVGVVQGRRRPAWGSGNSTGSVAPNVP